ncbi:MAG: hypothetical protein HQK94_18080 [Nitrospirae bacterium]|nr:hypothetical protein [Nitrospirota bacterium]
MTKKPNSIVPAQGQGDMDKDYQKVQTYWQLGERIVREELKYTRTGQTMAGI